MPGRRDYDTLDFGFELKSLDDAGQLEGYAAVFGNVDLGGDVIEPGAFTKTIEENGGQVPILWQHDRYEPIGVSTSLDQDRKGLLVKGQLNMDVQRGREARSLLNQGAMQGLSIGYRAIKAVKQSGARHLKELALKEFSPVVFPMNELAVARVKAAGDVVFGPEDGFNDLRNDLNALLNPGAPPNRFWVSDISVDLTAIVVRDYSADEAWVVPISVDDNLVPTIAPASDWVEAEDALVASSADGKSAIAALRAFAKTFPAGEQIAADLAAEFKDAFEPISALLAVAKPAPTATPTDDDVKAAMTALEPALATLRALTNDSQKEND